MPYNLDGNKTEPRFDRVVFHFCHLGALRTTEWDYGLPGNPGAGDAFLDDAAALGAAIWPVGRVVHVFMAGGR